MRVLWPGVKGGGEGGSVGGVGGAGGTIAISNANAAVKLAKGRQDWVLMPSLLDLLMHDSDEAFACKPVAKSLHQGEGNG